MKAIFIRVSKDDLSYEKQIPVIVKTFNLDLKECKIYEEIISAYRDEVQEKREAFIELEKDIQEGLIKEIYVFKFDRTQRNIQRSLQFYFFCEENGCKMYSAMEPHLNIDYGEDAMGTYLKYNNVLVTAFIAQGESENTSKRTKSAYTSEGFSYKGNKWGNKFSGTLDNPNNNKKGKVELSKEEIDQLNTYILSLKLSYSNIVELVKKKFKLKISQSYISKVKNDSKT
ncbi:MAG: recombinase family protein [Bacillota bacterium]